MEPRLLILETSGRVGQVALASGGTLLASRRLEEARRHARDLAPAVADLLAGQGWRPRDVEAILVSRGPGSYTGLRVGIMSAKTFAYATGCALLTIETFAAVAVQVPAEVTALEILADAQQDRLYVQRFVREAEGWQSAKPLAIRTLTEWQAERNPSDWISGPGLAVIRSRLPERFRLVDESAWHPWAESILLLGLARLAKGERDDLWTVEPLYLRPSAAEEKWQERSAR
jgi:tRNA threonylcarbamoyladenosine biosynthesis protein TsaB